jgi:hypothetical protein
MLAAFFSLPLSTTVGVVAFLASVALPVLFPSTSDA